MNSNDSNKWRIRAATLSIFLLGAIAGAFALNAFNLWFGDKPPMNREQRFVRIANELELSEPQQMDMRKVFDDTREKMQALRKEDEPRVKDIKAETDAKLQKVMSAEQWDKFVKMREKKHEEDKQRNANR